MANGQTVCERIIELCCSSTIALRIIIVRHHIIIVTFVILAMRVLFFRYTLILGMAAITALLTKTLYSQIPSRLRRVISTQTMRFASTVCICNCGALILILFLHTYISFPLLFVYLLLCVTAVRLVCYVCFLLLLMQLILTYELQFLRAFLYMRCSCKKFG